jgi:hypothetical protein
MPVKGAVQTENGDYEKIYYWVFGKVNYERTMFWTKGDGRIGIGNPMVHQDTNEKKTGVVLPAEKSLVVWSTNLKLV